MAAYKDLRFLDAAVRSIIDQDYPDFELIIVDDGIGLDGFFGRRAAPNRVRIMTNATNQGAMAAANRGIRAARGEIIARLDADDMAVRKRLGLQLGALDADPQLAVIGSNFINIDEAGVPGTVHRMPETDIDVRWTILFRNPFCHSSTTFQRTCYEAAGGYDESWKVSGDHEFWFRLLAQGRAANLQDVLLEYRINPRGLSALHSQDWRKRTDSLRRRAWANLGVPYDAVLAHELSHFVMGHEIADLTLRVPAYRVCLRLLRRFIGTPCPFARPSDTIDARRLVRKTVDRIAADPVMGGTEAIDTEDLAWARSFIDGGSPTAENDCHAYARGGRASSPDRAACMTNSKPLP